MSMTMNKASFFYSLIIIIGALLMLDGIWTEFLPAETSFKIIASLGIIGGAVLVVDLIRRQITEDKQLKKDKFID